MPSAKGQYSRQLISNTPADLNSPFALECKKWTQPFPEEGFYIYSFQENKMLYARGWEALVGIPDHEIGMVDIVDLSAPRFALFVEEVNDKALMFLAGRNERLTEYCFQIHLRLMHRNGDEVPVSAKVAVHDVREDGHLKSISGSFRMNRSLRFGEVMRLSSYGPQSKEFEDALDPALFKEMVISDKELEALKLASQGMANKQIADHLGISNSAVDKRLSPLLKRFNVRSRTHLLAFAIDNYLLDQE